MPPPAPPPTSDPPVEWSVCEGGGECAWVDVPLRWSEPEGELITLWVKRYRARRSAGQLWLLQGGPGGAAEGLEFLIDDFRAAAPTLDIYLVDHRGVGHSTRLGCGEWSGHPVGIRCVRALERQWGDGLAEFNPTAAARDLGHLVALMRGPASRVFVYGVSYGTYWAHRYLQLFPEQADGVVLDSICPPGGCLYGLYDLRFDEVGREWLEMCAADPYCNRKLGDDPAARMRALYRDLEGGHCGSINSPGEPPSERLRRLVTVLLASWSGRVLIAPLVHRLERCDADDVAVANELLSWVGDGVRRDEGLDSVVLQHHVLLSEMWGPDDLDAERVAQLESRTLFATGGPVATAELRPGWPRYEPDPLVRRWAESDTPLLMLNGTLDPQTPHAIAAPAGEHFDRPGQHFVTVDWAAHGVIIQSPIDGGATSCGLLMIASFLHDPMQVDTRCLRRLERPDFQGDEIARDLGLESLWRGGFVPGRFPRTQRLGQLEVPGWALTKTTFASSDRSSR